MNGLKDLLEDVAEQSKLYDVTEVAWVGGRRRRRTRQLATGSAGAIVVIVTLLTGTLIVGQLRSGNAIPPGSPSPPHPPPTPNVCEIERLPTPSGFPAEAVVRAVDPSGWYSVGTFAGAVDARQQPAIFWSGTTALTIDLPGVNDRLTGVNSKGTAVGQSDHGSEARAWVSVDPYAYRDPIELRTDRATFPASRDDAPYVQGTVAVAVNGAGVIVGHANGRPVRWRSFDAIAELLPMPAEFGYGYVTGLDEDGTVIGTLTRADGRTAAVRWLPDGTMLELAIPVLSSGVADSALTRRIQQGWITGAINLVGSPGVSLPAMWNMHNGAGMVLPGIREPAPPYGWFDEYDDSRRVHVVRSSAAVVSLPDLAGRLRYDPLTVTVGAFTPDGTMVVGAAQVAVGDTQPLVPTRWRCP